MIRDLISRYSVLGASLALMLQTNYRLADAVGPGEILACIYFVGTLAESMLRRGTVFFRLPDAFTLTFSLIVVLVIVPVTFLSAAGGTPGASFRDLISYIFVLTVAVSLPKGRRDIQAMIIAFLVVLFLTVAIHFAVGSDAAYYSFRFTGGAQNPNQLALYLAAAASLSAWLPNIVHRASVVALAIFFGLASGSDAFLVFTAASTLAFLVLAVLPSRATLVGLPLLLGIGVTSIVLTDVMGEILTQWGRADEGGARVRLWMFAIRAWTDNAFSFLVGHGAGSFSGLYGPFGLAEAHNTALDMATVGGVAGLLLFPICPLLMLLRALSLKQRFAAAVFSGLICYSLFHFVGRQPVFWVAIIMFGRQMDLAAELSKARLIQLRGGGLGSRVSLGLGGAMLPRR